LAGTWTATKAEYVGKVSGSRVDLVATDGDVLHEFSPGFPEESDLNLAFPR
jgi:hypothetical protein